MGTDYLLAASCGYFWHAWNLSVSPEKPTLMLVPNAFICIYLHWLHLSQKRQIYLNRQQGTCLLSIIFHCRNRTCFMNFLMWNKLIYLTKPLNLNNEILRWLEVNLKQTSCNHGVVWVARDLWRPSSPTCLQWAGNRSTLSGCSEVHPTWVWIFPAMEILLWVTGASVSSHSL